MYNLLAIFLLLSVSSYAQNEIHFVEMRLDNAISQAKIQNKPLFIDTYARYCIPCKQMEKEFRNPEVAAYFNKHFLNVRVNMETSYAPPFKAAYQIVYLPTFIFADKDGVEKIKIDNVISGRELLAFGKHVIERKDEVMPKSAPAPPLKPAAQVNTQTQKGPKSPASVPNPIPEEGGKILYVMGQGGDDLPPEILKEEAYFRMQLMDGTHTAASKKYLATQKDWNTEDNIRFIHDFINDSRSKEFQFLIDHRSRFENFLGKEVITQTIQILANKELERAYPRPNYERAVILHTYLGVKDPDLAAALYHMNWLYDSKKTEEFLAFGEPFMLDPRMKETNMLYLFSSEKAARHSSKEGLKASYKIAERAVELESSNPLYHYNLSQIAYLQRSKKKARKHAERALELSKGHPEAAKNIQLLQDQIESL